MPTPGHRAGGRRAVVGEVDGVPAGDRAALPHPRRPSPRPGRGRARWRTDERGRGVGADLVRRALASGVSGLRRGAAHHRQAPTRGPALLRGGSGLGAPPTRGCKLPPEQLGDALSAGRRSAIGVGLGEDLVDQAVGDGVVAPEDEVAVDVGGDPLDGLAGVVGEGRRSSARAAAPSPSPPAPCRSTGPGRRRGAGGSAPGSSGGRSACPWRRRPGSPPRPRRPGRCRGGHVAAEELHGVVDGEQGGHVAAGRVDVEADVLARVLGLEVQELGDDQVGDGVVELRCRRRSIRSCSRREQMSKARSPRAVCSMTVGMSRLMVAPSRVARTCNSLSCECTAGRAIGNPWVADHPGRGRLVGARRQEARHGPADVTRSVRLDADLDAVWALGRRRRGARRLARGSAVDVDRGARRRRARASTTTAPAAAWWSPRSTRRAAPRASRGGTRTGPTTPRRSTIAVEGDGDGTTRHRDRDARPGAAGRARRGRRRPAPRGDLLDASPTLGAAGTRLGRLRSAAPALARRRCVTPPRRAPPVGRDRRPTRSSPPSPTPPAASPAGRRRPGRRHRHRAGRRPAREPPGRGEAPPGPGRRRPGRRRAGRPRAALPAHPGARSTTPLPGWPSRRGLGPPASPQLAPAGRRSRPRAAPAVAGSRR